MTADEKFALIISGMGVMFMILCAVLGLLWRAGNHWGRLTSQVENLARSVGQIAIDTNERLQWLERSRGRPRNR